MTTFDTKFTTIEDFQNFVRDAQKTTGKAVVKHGSYIIPATSVMALIGIDLSDTVQVELEKDNDIYIFRCSKENITVGSKAENVLNAVKKLLEQHRYRLTDAEYSDVQKAFNKVSEVLVKR